MADHDGNVLLPWKRGMGLGVSVGTVHKGWIRGTSKSRINVYDYDGPCILVRETLLDRFVLLVLMVNVDDG